MRLPASVTAALVSVEWARGDVRCIFEGKLTMVDFSFMQPVAIGRCGSSAVRGGAEVLD